jgi:hypothetical protein
MTLSVLAQLKLNPSLIKIMVLYSLLMGPGNKIEGLLVFHREG